MISCQNFCLLCSFIREANKILYYIQQPLFLKYTFKKGIKLRMLCIFIIAIFRFPLHETIFARSNCTCLRCQLITHNTNTIVNKHRWDFMHIIANLCICLRSIRFLSRWRFKLHKNNWKTI